MNKLQLKIALTCLFTIFVLDSAFSANERFRSVSSGNWNVAAT